MTLHNRWHTEQRVPDGEDSRERGRKGRGDGRVVRVGAAARERGDAGQEPC